VQDGGLEDDARAGERLGELELDRVGLVGRHGGHREELGRAHEEVAVERGEADACGARALVRDEALLV
jgi:hypothetical protein